MFQVLIEECTPERATEFSSCVDLFAREDITINAGDTKIVPLGVKIDLSKVVFERCPYCGSDENYQDRFAGHYCDNCGKQLDDESAFMDFKKSYCLELKCRSSLPLKKGLIIANGVGEIDLDYPDEIGILLHKPYSREDMGVADINEVPASIKKGDKIAQVKLVEHKSYLMGYESKDKRVGGFGSSDKN